MATLKVKVALAIVPIAVVLTVYVLASHRLYRRSQTLTGNGRPFLLSILPAKGATAGNKRPSIVSKDDDSIMDPDHTPLAPKERGGADPINAQPKKSSGVGANTGNVPMKDGVDADTGRSPFVPMKIGVVADNRRQSFHYSTTVAQRGVTTASNKLATTKPPNINYDLPFITKGSTEIRPERLPPPTNSSDIYFSLLTAPKFHNLRFSLQYLTWLQTVDAKQVTIRLCAQD